MRVPKEIECLVQAPQLHFTIEVPAGGNAYAVVDRGATVSVFGPSGKLVGDTAGRLEAPGGGPRRASSISARTWAFKILRAHEIVI